MNNTDLQNRPQYQEEDSIDLKVLIIKILSYWYLFVIGVVVALAFGFFYIRYTPSTYQTSASVFIKEDKMGIDPTSMMTGLTFKSNINIDNEIGILQSFSLRERTIKELEFFNVSYYIKGRVATRELYKDAPFNVELDYDTLQVVGNKYEIEFLKIIYHRNIISNTELSSIVNSCLLCSEPTPEQCHRRLLAEQIRVRYPNVKIVHL